jgi:hypothetical protein
VVRFAVLAIVVIIVSTFVGGLVAIFPRGETTTPFSQCDTYPPFSAPGSCQTLAYYLSVLGIVLLVLVAAFIWISRRRRS